MLSAPVWRRSLRNPHRFYPAYPAEERGLPGERPMAGMEVSSSAGMEAASSVVGVEAASSTVFAVPSAFPPGLGLQNIATASMPEHHPDSLEHAFEKLKEAAKAVQPHKSVADMETASSVAGEVPASQAASSSSAAAEGAHSAHGTLVHGKAVKGKGKGKGTRQYAPAGFWNPIITLNDAGKVKWPDLPNAKAKRQLREQVRKMSYNKSKSRGDSRWSPPRFVKETAPPPVCNWCGVMWKQPPQVIVCVQNSLPFFVPKKVWDPQSCR